MGSARVRLYLAEGDVRPPRRTGRAQVRRRRPSPRCTRRVSPPTSGSPTEKLAVPTLILWAQRGNFPRAVYEAYAERLRPRADPGRRCRPPRADGAARHRGRGDARVRSGAVESASRSDSRARSSRSTPSAIDTHAREAHLHERPGPRAHCGARRRNRARSGARGPRTTGRACSARGRRAPRETRAASCARRAGGPPRTRRARGRPRSASPRGRAPRRRRSASSGVITSTCSQAPRRRSRPARARASQKSRSEAYRSQSAPTRR